MNSRAGPAVLCLQPLKTTVSCVCCVNLLIYLCTEPGGDGQPVARSSFIVHRNLPNPTAAKPNSKPAKKSMHLCYDE